MHFLTASLVIRYCCLNQQLSTSNLSVHNALRSHSYLHRSCTWQHGAQCIYQSGKFMIIWIVCSLAGTTHRQRQDYATPDEHFRSRYFYLQNVAVSIQITVSPVQIDRSFFMARRRNTGYNYAQSSAMRMYFLAIPRKLPCGLQCFVMLIPINSSN